MKEMLVAIHPEGAFNQKMFSFTDSDSGHLHLLLIVIVISKENDDQQRK